MKKYEQIEHTADLGAKIYGTTLPELFENAAFCMFDMMTDLSKVVDGESIEIKAEAPDKESLLVVWLNELLYAATTGELIFSEFDVKSLDENSILAEARGRKLKAIEGIIDVEIKAATFHDVEIAEGELGYEVVIVFDV
ncbi:MAG: archease [Candidatus Omnitrophica bacterium]|nr:archease [Candidatus Omnitrophota bacterium]